MENHGLLDENNDEILTLYGQQKARQTGLWMMITSVSGLVLFAGFICFAFYSGVGDIDEEGIVIMVFALCMTIKYALLLAGAIQTRQGALPGRSRLLFTAVFNTRLVWIFVGILALVFLLQVILYWTTGYKMFGEITSEFFHVYWEE